MRFTNHTKANLPSPLIPERLSVEADLVEDVLEEAGGRFLYHVLHAQPHLEVLHQSLHEVEEVLGGPDVAWYCL